MADKTNHAHAEGSDTASDLPHEHSVPQDYEVLRHFVLENPYIPVTPTVKQALFCMDMREEVLFGGAAGGGKSVALLMSALMFVEKPGYNALLLRRQFTDLMLPDALIPMSQEWLRGTDARWDGNQMQWTFPSGAMLQFGYLASEHDKFRYQGAQLQFIGWDELTQFNESQYRYLFSRTRKKKLVDVPLRIRAASNPGGVGHSWVFRRFVGPKAVGGFIPSRLSDNEHLDRVQYEQMLEHLDPVTRARLRDGDWMMTEEGGVFDGASMAKMREFEEEGVDGMLVEELS